MAQAILSSEATRNRANTDTVSSSAISWGAVLAGAVAAAALSLILFLLGTGLGLTSISPWAREGVDASTFGVSAIIWITVTQILAAGMGGYLAGRLRVRWTELDQDEVYFRDTAHGFLTWAVATLATAALLTTTIGALVNSGVQATANLAGGAAKAGAVAAGAHASQADNQASGKRDDLSYFVDSLFRQDANASAGDNGNAGASGGQSSLPTHEVTRIFKHSMTQESLPAEDTTYLAQLISRHTGLSQAEAEQRVNDVYTNMQAKADEAKQKAKEAADKARKASIYITLWLFVSLLIGAFSASLTATWGGRCRDA